MRAAMGHKDLEEVEDDEDADHVVTSPRRGARISGQSTLIYLDNRRGHCHPRALLVTRHAPKVIARPSAACYGLGAVHWEQNWGRNQGPPFYC